MNILVTGATGFVGSHLCRALVNRGYRVYGTTKSGNTERIRDILGNENFKLIKIDLTNKEEMHKLPKNIDVIYHNASLLPRKAENFNDYLVNNVLSTHNLLEYATKISNIKLFIQSSTCSVYVDVNDKTITEHTKENPVSYYGITKYFSDELVRLYSNNHKFKSVILRYTIVYGKDETRSMVYRYYTIATRNEDILLNKEISKKYRNVVHIDDVISANICAIEKIDNLPDFGVYLIGSKNSERVIDIVNKIIKYSNSKSKIVLTDDGYYNTMDSIIDLSKAEKILGYKPMTIEEGIKKYIKEVRGGGR